MIFIDNKEWRMPDELKTKMQKMCPAKLAYPKEFETISVDDKGGKISEWPGARGVPYAAKVMLNLTTGIPDPMGHSVVVRYCPFAPTTLPNGLPNFTVSSMLNGNGTTLNTQDYELLWFLSHCSPFISNSLNAKANRSKEYALTIVDENRNAKAEIEEKKWKSRAEFLIYNAETDGGLNVEAIRRLAQAYYVPNTKELGEERLRIQLYKKVEYDEKFPQVSGDPTEKGFRYFVDMVKKEVPSVDIRVWVQLAIDCGAIVYDTTRGAWFYGLPRKDKTEVIQPSEKIVKCSPEIRNKAIVDFLIKSADAFDTVKETVEQYEVALKIGKLEYPNPDEEQVLSPAAANSNPRVLELKTAIKEIENSENPDTDALIELYEELVQLNGAPVYKGKLNALKGAQV